MHSGFGTGAVAFRLPLLLFFGSTGQKPGKNYLTTPPGDSWWIWWCPFIAGGGFCLAMLYHTDEGRWWLTRNLVFYGLAVSWMAAIYAARHPLSGYLEIAWVSSSPAFCPVLDLCSGPFGFGFHILFMEASCGTNMNETNNAEPLIYINLTKLWEPGTAWNYEHTMVNDSVDFNTMKDLLDVTDGNGQVMPLHSRRKDMCILRRNL